MTLEQLMPHPGEAAEARLREYWPQRGNGDKEGVSQFKEHEYYLAPLVPPASFMPDLTSLPEGLWLSRRGVRSVMHSVGRLLGGADELTERRWQHVADGTVLRQVGALVIERYIMPAGLAKDEHVRMCSLCLPGGCCAHPAHSSVTACLVYPPCPSLPIPPHCTLPRRARSRSPRPLPRPHAHTPPTDPGTLWQEQVVARARHEAVGRPARLRGAPPSPARRERGGVRPSRLP